MSDTQGQSESQAPGVPEKATQGAETHRNDWTWVEASVWSERMLAALENGVKGGQWFSLIDKVYADGCGRYCESRRSDREWHFVERIISAGPINSSRPRDCSPCIQPGSWRANPDEETTDWRAVCGRTARTVRRAETAKAVSDPYRGGESSAMFLIPRCLRRGSSIAGLTRVLGQLDSQ